jgi:hypothetical protein
VHRPLTTSAQAPRPTSRAFFFLAEIAVQLAAGHFFGPVGQLRIARQAKKLPPPPVNGKGNYGGPKVRDRLCQLIRQHQLDANLVKSYAVDFCGTNTLREASREQVEGLVSADARLLSASSRLYYIGIPRLGSINLRNAVYILERVRLQVFHGLDQGSDNPAQ